MARFELFANAVCLGPVAATGSSEQLAGGIAVRVPANATTAFSATVTDVAGNVSACSGGSLRYAANTRRPRRRSRMRPGARRQDP